MIRSIPILDDSDRESVCGVRPYNAVAKAIRNIESETLSINIKPDGGLKIETAMDEGVPSYAFGVELNGNDFTIADGAVHFPDRRLDVYHAQFSIDDALPCYYIECTHYVAQILRGAEFPTMFDRSSLKIYLPLLTATSQGGVVYRHIGDYVFDFVPYIWTGYSGASNQVYYHFAGGEPQWVTRDI